MRLKDYYAALEIDPTATQEEVAQAYKRLAKKWHPDRNPSPDATARMQEINEAYFILRDVGKRARYNSLFQDVFKATRNESTRHEAEPSRPSSWRTEPEVEDQEFEGWMKEARNWAQENMGYAATETANMVKEGAMGGLMNLIGAVVFGLVMWLIFSIASC